MKFSRPNLSLTLPTVRLQGGLFLPDILEKAALGQSRLQTEADYAIPKGLTVRDEYSRAFQIASAQWRTFAALLDRTDFDPQQASTKFVTELLRDALGYPALAAISGISVGDRHYPVTHIANGSPAAQGADAKPVAVVIAPHTLGLDDADARFAVEGGGVRRKSPFDLAQDLLNASPDHEWALVTNGKTLRLLRDAATLTRSNYLEVDLQDLLAGQRLNEFSGVWRLLHASRGGLLEAATPGKPPVVWNVWQKAGQEEGTRVREGLSRGVTEALITLGQGFLQHPANDALRRELRDGNLKKEQYFGELLRLVYRFIFLFSVEERGLVPNTAQPGDDDETARQKRAGAQLYVEGYAMARLRDLAVRRRARTRFDDLWHGVRIVFTGLVKGEPRLGLPALGGLFALDQCPHLDEALLSNAALLGAMQSLRWAASPRGSLAPIDYRNMDTEELGSVYESLLELVPEVDVHARHFGFIGLTSVGSTAGNERKTSGSYYTPDSLVQELVRSALDPVIEQRIADSPSRPVEALLSLRVVDPACGSGHFLLAAARRLAERVASLRSADSADGRQAYPRAIREVVARCIFGVDRNPMAVELARTALWIEGFEEGRPLSFLDHHLQCGDALLGLMDLHALEKGIAKDAFKALSGDDKVACRELSKRNNAGLKQLAKDLKGLQQTLGFNPQPAALDALRAIEVLPAETADEVAAKEAAYRQLLVNTANSPLAVAADVAVGAYLLPKTPDVQDSVPTTETLHAILTGSLGLHGVDREHAQACQAAREACKAARVFHWPLAFPQVFAQGGFNCVLGNPPWERIKLQEEEFFATRHPAIAEAKNKTERSQRIQWLSEGMLSQHLYPDDTAPHSPAESDAERRLYEEFISARRTAEAASVYVHLNGDDGGRYPLTGVGDVNTYALFAETILQIHAAQGRAGFIVPTGIATDDTTKAYFGRLVQSARLVSLLGFWEIRRLFPGTDSRDSFCLITLGPAERAEFIFHAKDLADLRDARRRFTLSPDEFRLLNPNTLTCPIFRSASDAELTKKLYRAAPVLIRDGAGGEADSNPWGISFMRMLDMANDSHLFKDSPAPDRLPLYEAKLIHHFDHRWATYKSDGETRDFTPEEKRNPATTITPRYWVPQREVWLRVSTLPEGLKKALQMLDATAIELCVTQLLFGWWLTDHPDVPLHPAWQLFVRQYPYAAKVAPTSLGLCGDNPPSIKPLDDNYLPAEGSFEVFMSSERRSTAWYAADPVAWERVLEFTAGQRGRLQAPEAILAEQSDVLLLAEQWLEESCPKWLLGWRDICRATDERTTIAAVVPLAGIGHTMPLLLSRENASSVAALLANLCSMTLDYCARVKVGGTHLTYGYIKQFPVLPPNKYEASDLTFIVPRVLELTFTTNDLAAWASALGYAGPPFAFDSQRRAVLRAELDAYYARLYNLSRDDLRYLLDPAEVMGEDYPTETFRVLKQREQNAKDIGEYRTRRLVLDAWDRLQAGTLH